MPTRHILMLCALTAMAVQAGAEELHTRFFRDVTVVSGVHFQRWQGEGDLSIREISVPLAFVLPVGKRLSLDVSTGSGFASLDQGGSRSLGGLTNTRVRASYVLGEELALLTVGVSTPTGKTELDADEQQVSAYLAQNALGFRTPHFGQGLDVNVGLATARRFGDSVVGLGASYLVKGAYDPWEGSAEYQPGNEIGVTVGLDRRIADRTGRISIDVVYTLYGEDRFGGAQAFQSGDRVLVQALGTWRAWGADWRAYAIERHKGDSTRQWVGSSETYANGNQLETGLSLLAPTTGAVAFRLTADMKAYTDNAYDYGEALIVAAGPGLRLRLSPRRHVDVTAKYARGTIDDASVSGLDLSASIWLGL